MVFDYAIFGGGVVGSAIFNKLTRVGKTCVLLEKENDVGFGSSKANSGIVHTGFDCKPGTLKAKLNVIGCKQLPNIAKRLGVRYLKNGHLVVGNDLEKINELYNRGIKNGVKNLEIINTDALHKMEPNLSPDIKYALYAKDGGIISSYELSVALCEEAIINGGTVIREFITNSIQQNNDKLYISDGKKEIVADNIINCAGAGYNGIAKLLHTEQFDVEFRRGEYYLLDKSCSNFATKTIFPLPTEKSKGILVTPTTFGNIIVGPTSYVSDERTITTSQGLAEIKKSVKSNFPTLPFKSNIRVFSGVRNLVGDDFIIEKSKINNKVVNIAGICSPGLTCCTAIADYLLSIIGIKNIEKKNLKLRKKPVVVASLPSAKQDEIIKQNPAYGKIVCKCEEVSLGEICDALNSPLPPLSVDGVKRRTRAGMGRCQGGFCIFSVMNLLAKNKKINFDDIEKDASGSTIICSSIKPNEGGN